MNTHMQTTYNLPLLAFLPSINGWTLCVTYHNIIILWICFIPMTGLSPPPNPVSSFSFIAFTSYFTFFSFCYSLRSFFITLSLLVWLTNTKTGPLPDIPGIFYLVSILYLLLVTSVLWQWANLSISLHFLAQVTSKLSPTLQIWLWLQRSWRPLRPDDHWPLAFHLCFVTCFRCVRASLRPWN